MAQKYPPRESANFTMQKSLQHIVQYILNFLRNQEKKLEKGEFSTPSGGRYGQRKFLTIMKDKKKGKGKILPHNVQNR